MLSLCIFGTLLTGPLYFLGYSLSFWCFSSIYWSKYCVLVAFLSGWPNSMYGKPGNYFLHYHAYCFGPRSCHAVIHTLPVACSEWTDWFPLRGGLGRLLGVVCSGDCFYRWHSWDCARFWALPSTCSNVFLDSLASPAALHGVLYGLKYTYLAHCIRKTSYNVARGPVAMYHSTNTKSVLINSSLSNVSYSVLVS